MEVVNHYNIRRVVDIYANVQDRDLGAVSRQITKILDGNAKSLPRGTFVTLKGQVDTMRSSYTGLARWSGIFHRACLPAHRGQFSELDRSVHHHYRAARGARRHRAVSLSHAHHTECACTDGRHHVHGRGNSQQHSGCIVCQEFASMSTATQCAQPLRQAPRASGL